MNNRIKIQVFEIVHCSPIYIHTFVIFYRAKIRQILIEVLRTGRFQRYLHLEKKLIFFKVSTLSFEFLKNQAQWSLASKILDCPIKQKLYFPRCDPTINSSTFGSVLQSFAV